MKMRIWMGHKQHFIGAANCQFSLATYVGDYIVSTIGEYMPYGDKIEEIGYGRKYETFVFESNNKMMECGCYEISKFSEIDSLPANTAEEATENHMEMCEKWGRKNDE